MINFKSDTHVHTQYSPDADPNATFQSYIKKAKKLGLEEIIFTDHVDFDAAHPLFEKMIDYDEYIDDFKKCVSDELDLTVKLGVEIGYQSHTKKDIKEFLRKYPFEHVILSVHYMEKKDLYTKEFFVGKSKEEAYGIYFKTLLEAVTEVEDYSVVGHFDYISRYSDFEDYDYETYKEIIDLILRVIIQKGKGIEINTSGFNYEGRQYPKNEVINRYLELGGTYVTIGSDSHNTNELTRNYSLIENRIFKT